MREIGLACFFSAIASEPLLDNVAVESLSWTLAHLSAKQQILNWMNVT